MLFRSMSSQVEDGTVVRRGSVVGDWTSRIILGDRVGISDPPAWLVASYLLFRSHVMDSAYPCFFGTQAERAGEMFYSHVSAQDLGHVAGTMATFIQLSSAREHEKNNFALFFEPEPTVLAHDAYRTLFWQTLQLLHDRDTVPISEEEMLDPSSPSWEFTYNGQQLFVVGCCPSYQQRRSRNLGPGMVMLFQPRTVFVDAVTKRAIGPQARAEVRRRLLAWGILHRYSDLRWWMRRLPEPARPTLDALADCWFATE